MIIQNVMQGSPEWLALRQNYYTASEAVAMMGVSRHTTRTQLLQEKATGVRAPVDKNTQYLFDKGHATEAAARPHAGKIIGDDLFPVVGTRGKLLASFDGLTILGDINWEHKLWNAKLIDQILIDELEPEYWVQLEQQLYVSGAEKCLFMCSDGTEEKCAWMWYYPVPGRIETILAGWEQFEKDLKGFRPQAKQEKIEGVAPNALPVIRLDVTGMVTYSNLDVWRSHAKAVIGEINTVLVTDQDFADAEKSVKWCKAAEASLKEAKEAALSQTASIDEVFKLIDDVSAELRSKRLELEKLVKEEKESIRQGIKTDSERELAKHAAELAEKLGVNVPVAADIAGAMKGKKTLDSLRDAANTEVAKAKIAATQKAAEIEANLAVFSEAAKGAEFLFPDRHMLVLQGRDAMLETVGQRLESHKAAQLAVQAAQQAAQQQPAPAPQVTPQAAPQAEEMVTITRAEYVALIENSRLLEALIDAGVKDWRGWSEAYQDEQESLPF